MAHPTRNTIAVAAIAVAACFGASHLFVGMANERLQRAQAAETRARLTAANAEHNANIHARNLELGNSVRAAVIGINNANRHATSAASLYDQYSTLADQLGLTTHRLGPTTTPGTTSARRSTRAAEPTTPNQPIAYLAELEGPIQSITRFLDTIEHDLGHTRIINARITPVGMNTRPPSPNEAHHSDDTRTVRLSITTLHFRFDPPDLPASLIAAVPTENTP